MSEFNQNFGLRHAMQSYKYSLVSSFQSSSGLLAFLITSFSQHLLLATSLELTSDSLVFDTRNLPHISYYLSISPDSSIRHKFSHHETPNLLLSVLRQIVPYCD